METTVILLKPDCVQKALCGEVLRRFEAAGLLIRGMKMMNLTSEVLRDHYSHLTSKPFYPEIESFMKSGPVVAAALAGPGAVDKVREMIGPTDSTKAPKGSVRGDFGVDVMRNIVHASDSVENAQKELGRFFKDGEILR